MRKQKRKGNPRIRTFLLAAIFMGMMLSAFGILAFFQTQAERNLEEAYRLTQEYILCTATRVSLMPLHDLTEQVSLTLEQAGVPHEDVHASILYDFCTNPPSYRPGYLALTLLIPEPEFDDAHALGIRLQALLMLLEPIPLEQIGQITVRFADAEDGRQVGMWIMQREDAFYLLGEDIAPETLLEEGWREY